MEKYIENPTQEEQILKMLHEKEWVSSLDIVLHTYILQYNARIYGLRQKGHEIKCEMRKVTNRFWQDVTVWFYKLIQGENE